MPSGWWRRMSSALAVGRHHGDAAAVLGEHAQDVALGAVIDGDDLIARLVLSRP